MFYSVQQGSRYILSQTNQRSWFEVRRLQHHQQIKAHGHTLQVFEQCPVVDLYVCLFGIILSLSQRWTGHTLQVFEQCPVMDLYVCLFGIILVCLSGMIHHCKMLIQI
jgi:hypothetical protein